MPCTVWKALSAMPLEPLLLTGASRGVAPGTRSQAARTTDMSACSASPCTEIFWTPRKRMCSANHRAA